MKHDFACAEYPSVIYKAYGCRWEGDTFRRAYEVIVNALTAAGLAPTHLAAVAPGVGEKYGSFSHKHRRLLQSIGQAERVEFTRGDPDGIHPDTSGYAYCHLDSRRNYGGLAWIPETVDGGGANLHAAWRDLLDVSKSRYSYRFLARWHPQDCPHAVNIVLAQWAESRRAQLTLWLHDIFPHNYLSDQYLDAPVGHTGMSLREWIEADPERRGTLLPYTDALLDWTPPVAEIPVIREKLYRMGRMFSHHFLQETTVWAKAMADRFGPNPLYRPDPYAPWEAPADYPIPARFLAETYRGTDPALTTWRRFDSPFDAA